MHGMAVSGISVSNSSTTATAVVDGRVVVANGVGYGEAVQCREPRRDEICAVRAAAASGEIKLGYNVRARKLAIGIGYVFLLVPGILLNALFVHGESELEREAHHAASTIDCSDAALTETDEVRQSERRNAVPAADAAASPGVKHPWHCTISAVDPIATACMSDEQACARLREQRITETPDLSVCVPIDVVSCFAYVDKSDSTHRRRCAPSRVTCTQQLADALAKPDEFGDVGECSPRG